MKKAILTAMIVATTAAAATATAATAAATHNPINIASAATNQSRTRGAVYVTAPNANVIREIPIKYNANTHNPTVQIPAHQVPYEYRTGRETNYVVRIDQAGHGYLHVEKASEHAIRYVDLASGKLVATQNLRVTGSLESYRTDTDDLMPPVGYTVVKTLGAWSFAQGNRTVYVSNSPTITYSYMAGNAAIKTETVASSHQPQAPRGYQFTGKTGLEGYGLNVYFKDGHPCIPVERHYTGETVPVKFVNANGQTIKIGTGEMTSNANLNLHDLPQGYRLVDYRGDMQKGAATRNFVFNVTLINNQPAAKQNDDAEKLAQLEQQYTDLLAKYNQLLENQAGSTTTIISKENPEFAASLQNLQSRISVVEAGMNKTATVAPNKVTQIALTGTATITGAPAKIYDANFQATKRTLTPGSNWKVFGIITDGKGNTYYNLGGSQYVRVNAANFRTSGATKNANVVLPMRAVATVKYVPGYGIQMWGKNFTNFVKNSNGTNKKLPHNTKWKVFGVTTHNGHVYYNLGGNQYADARYVTIK